MNNGTATDLPYGFRLHKRFTDGPPPVDFRVVGASTTVKVGDLVYIIAATGLLGIHTAGNAEKIYGIADQGGTTGDRIQVTPITPNDILNAQSTSTVVVAQSDIGDTCEIAGTTGVMGLNVGTATNAIMKIVDLLPGSTLGKWCELQCKILAAASAWQA